ncbi:DnaJ/Hsp40 cysteine-rich domain superfamily protein, partial [Prunus dulcis]
QLERKSDFDQGPKSTVQSRKPAIVAKSIHNKGFASPSRALNRVAGVVPYGTNGSSLSSRFRGVRASAVDSYESSSDFVNRMEKAWLISKQPRPVACSSCDSNGHIECKWCGAQASLCSAITCFAKSLREVLVVLFVLERTVVKKFCSQNETTTKATINHLIDSIYEDFV